jgi:heterogeneous nuclear ribonucleoprotein A/B/D
LARHRRKLFVGGISLFTTLSSMRAFFGNFGDIEDATIITDRSTGISRGFGFVIFRHTDAAAAVMACSTSLRLEGHAIETKFALSKDRMENRIFVGGLPPDLRSESLHAFFSQYGVVQEAVIATDPATGRTRGFGFVMLGESSLVSLLSCL